MQERRTNPGFLSDGETARESRRLEQMVKGFLKWNPLVRVGETDNFAVDYDKRERLVFIYGKETPRECPFKLAFNESEVSAIQELLVKTRPFFKER